MASIFYLREGSGSERLIDGFDIIIERLMAKVGSRTVIFMGDTPPTIQTDRQDLTPIRDPSHVLVKISDAEINQRFSKEGFYILEMINPIEASSWNQF